MTSRANTAKRKLAEQDRLGSELVIRSIMSTPHGRRWVWTILEAADMFCVDRILDPQWLAFKDGRKELGLMILKLVQGYTPQDYIRMVSESTEVNLQITDAATADRTPPENEE